ncbi:DNA-directed DNA polymerase [Malassezia vespertilionis]|uniref:DNA-directed DNA polymerase n=1 Tax=Malassezia vespertilionis TaxID=2020962 RepID=UPI0024B1B7E1|nr:DNA-directed DNA polymerase [Malassezia vespertilionis]WFD05604.1 DNA-directed DNA polymerase [Malassezia vespertilionis]
MDGDDFRTSAQDAADEDVLEGIPLSSRTMSATNAVGGTFGLGIDQFELPKASINKLARTEIPDSVQLRKDTLTALVKSASVFVSYLSTYYNMLIPAAASQDVAIARGNKTISAAHVLDAMRELEFPLPMRKALREELQGTQPAKLTTAYRDLQKRNAATRADAAARSRAIARAKATEKASEEALQKEHDAEETPKDAEAMEMDQDQARDPVL